jgi:hypothetical protein
LFALVIPAYFLPVLTIAFIFSSCLDSPPRYTSRVRIDRTFTGWDLATSRTDEVRRARREDNVDAEFDRQRLAGAIEESQPWFTAALVVALLGVLLSWLRDPKGGILAIVLGLAGALLFALGTGFVVPESEWEYEPGFWVVVWLFVGAAGSGIFRLISYRLGLPQRVPIGPIADPRAAVFELVVHDAGPRQEKVVDLIMESFGIDRPAAESALRAPVRGGYATVEGARMAIAWTGARAETRSVVTREDE